MEGELNDNATALNASAHPRRSSKAGMATEMIAQIGAGTGFLSLHLSGIQ